MNGILYQSATGHTRRYAEMLSKATGLSAFDLFEARKHLRKGDEVIFMGWIRGRDLMGYGLFLRRYDVKAICVVGAAPNPEKAFQTVRKHYKIQETPLFYLRGGIASSKIRGSDRRVFEMLKSDLAKKQASKRKNISAQDAELLQALVKDSDYVAEENLAEVIQWFEEKKK